jgi:hypothetical protein
VAETVDDPVIEWVDVADSLIELVAVLLPVALAELETVSLAVVVAVDVAVDEAVLVSTLVAVLVAVELPLELPVKVPELDWVTDLVELPVLVAELEADALPLVL